MSSNSTDVSSSSPPTSSIGTSPSSPPSSSASGANDPSTPSPATSISPASTSSNVVATSASPTSQSTTQSSAVAQTSSPAASAQSSSPVASTSNSFVSTTTPVSSTPSTITTQVATTLASTDSAGSVFVYTTTVPDTISTTIVTTGTTSSSNSGSSSSHTGVIVGAIVGGVAGIALLILLFFCIRKRVKRDEFDGNFDPDRVVGRSDGDGTLPNVDLAEEVTPFPQTYSDQGSASMRQYGGPPYLPVPSSLSQSSSDLYRGAAGGSATAIDTQSRPYMQPGPYAPPVNMYGAGPVDWRDPQQRISPPPSTSSYNSSARAAKEREAVGQGQGLVLATQPETTEDHGDVVVHRDGGRAPVEEHASPKEIPPAYESIPRD